jgi:superfamily I DNA/RNA helicase
LVNFDGKDVLIYLAAAGAGKTRALMDDMAAQMKSLRPDQIAFVTFTRKGVAVGKDRALLACPYLHTTDLVYFRTLHSLCFNALGLKRDAILSEGDIKEINKINAGHNLSYGRQNKQAYNCTRDDRMLMLLDAARSIGQLYPNDYAGEDEGEYLKFIHDYTSYKNETGKFDYTDCLVKYLEEGKVVDGVKVAFIDEAQDLTPLQWKVCEKAFSAAEKIRIAGDDFQCIFSYASAFPDVLIDLAKRYPVKKLEISHRLSNSVYAMSKGLVELVEKKVDKDYRPANNKLGEVTRLNRVEVPALLHSDFQRHGYKPGRWYLLFRVNKFITHFSGALRALELPYHTQQGFCLNNRVLTKIKRFQTFTADGGNRDSEACKKFCEENGVVDINAPFSHSNIVTDANGVDGVRLKLLYEGYVDRYGVQSLVDWSTRKPWALLSTTHQVKGGEAENVIVFLDATRKIDEEKLLHLDEELRVLYVACTRARKNLYVVNQDGLYGFDDIFSLAEQLAPKDAWEAV